MGFFRFWIHYCHYTYHQSCGSVNSMIPKLKYLILLIFVIDMVLLGVMVHFTSWPFMIAFVLISGLAGGWVLNEGLRNYFRKGQASGVNRNTSAEDFLLGAVARLSAGVLLIVPGVLTDIVALCLLSPAGKWLTKMFFVSLFLMYFPQLGGNQYDYQDGDEKQAKDEIIDVKVIDPVAGRLEHEE